MNSKPSPARRCALALAALSGSLAGCSFIFSQAPPPDHESRDHFSCSGVVPPVLDTVWATLNFVGAAYAGSTAQRTWDQSSHLAGRQASLLGGVASGLLYGASSIYGYVVAADCSAAEEALLQRGGTVEPRFTLGGPAPPPPLKPIPQVDYVPPASNRPGAHDPPPATPSPPTATPDAPPATNPAPYLP